MESLESFGNFVGTKHTPGQEKPAPGRAPGPGHASTSADPRAPWNLQGGFDPKLGKEIRLDRGRGQDGTPATGP